MAKSLMELPQSILAYTFALTLLGACSQGPVEAGQTQKADLVLQDGAIYTVNPDRSWQQAVAIRDGRIVYVGSDQGVVAFTGPETRVVDLRGRMVLPGLQDVHIHPISGGIEASSCDLNGLQTAAQYRGQSGFALDHRRWMVDAGIRSRCNAAQGVA
jgi:imidazolonepropionase-like amidohydrolase